MADEESIEQRIQKALVDRDKLKWLEQTRLWSCSGLLSRFCAILAVSSPRTWG